MSAFERFAVVRVPFPFTDRQAQKRRPALVLSLPDFQQACGHLLAAGLPQPCVVRQRLFTLDERLVLGRLGALVAADRTAVAAQMAKLLPPSSLS